MGTPRHQVTPETRQLVKTAAGLGLPYRLICPLVGVTEKTLMKRYRKEIEEGKAKACFNVAKTLYDSAVSGDTTAGIWWTKTQMGWKEPPREITTPPGQPIGLTYVPGGPELLADYYARLDQAAAGAPDPDPRPLEHLGPAGQPRPGPESDQDPVPRGPILSPR